MTKAGKRAAVSNVLLGPRNSNREKFLEFIENPGGMRSCVLFF